jgi:hypothetical protein
MQFVGFFWKNFKIKELKALIIRKYVCNVLAREVTLLFCHLLWFNHFIFCNRHFHRNSNLFPDKVQCKGKGKNK